VTSRRRSWLLAPVACLLAFAGFVFSGQSAGPDDFHFVILGDRTGETQGDTFQRVWRDAGAGNPAFVVTVGDTIQGFEDATAESQWREVERVFGSYRRDRLFLTPGNHDIWSPASEKLFVRYAGHPAHYSFDYGPAHFTILDNSRSDELSPEEIRFLETDLKAHASQPLKFIVSHRPSWLFNAVAGHPDFPLHRLARQYGVQSVIAGHLHEMLHFRLEGVDYISVPSAGGHLRGAQKYEDGWFFGYIGVDIRKNEANFQFHFRINEVPLSGQPRRVTQLSDWGPAGLSASLQAPG
jgi:3',5'-cyclic-AMP phosphodiesterase